MPPKNNIADIVYQHTKSTTEENGNDKFINPAPIPIFDEEEGAQ